MMLSLVPACSSPTVTTAVSAPATSRETTPCSRTTVAAAMSTGSTVVSGREPCAPRPCSITCSVSDAANAGPGVQPEEPRGQRRHVLAEHDVGPAEPVEQAVLEHRLGAPASSSAGWNTAHQRAATTRTGRAASASAAPSRQVTCTSWPQACMSGTVLPSGPSSSRCWRTAGRSLQDRQARPCRRAAAPSGRRRCAARRPRRSRRRRWSPRSRARAAGRPRCRRCGARRRTARGGRAGRGTARPARR